MKLCVIYECLIKTNFRDVLNLNDINNIYNTNNNINFINVLHEFNNNFTNINYRIY